MKTELKCLCLHEITSETEIQQRSRINDETVVEYMEVMKRDGASAFPPLDVFTQPAITAVASVIPSRRASQLAAIDAVMSQKAATSTPTASKSTRPAAALPGILP